MVFGKSNEFWIIDPSLHLLNPPKEIVKSGSWNDYRDRMDF